MDLVRAGSDAAFEAIVARYRRALLRYCSRILPEDRAEDVVQQTFVKAYDAMGAGAAELALRPWLYRIAHNTALNALRDRGLRHEALHENIDGVEQPDQALERAQGLRAVLAAVQALPERQRDAMVLRELEGRSYDEIALVLGVTGGAVRQLLNRARHSVRAAATAVTPAGLLERVPWGAHGQPLAERVSELCGAAGSGTVVAKVCATALVTGAVVSGVAVAPHKGDPSPARARPPASAKSDAAAHSHAAVTAGSRSAVTRSSAVGGPLSTRTVNAHARRGGSGSGSRGDREGSDDGALRRGDNDRGEPRDELTMRRQSGGLGDSEPEHSGSDHSSPGGGGSEAEPADTPKLDAPGSLDTSGSGSSGSGSSSSGPGGPVPEPGSD